MDFFNSPYPFNIINQSIQFDRVKVYHARIENIAILRISQHTEYSEFSEFLLTLFN